MAALGERVAAPEVFTGTAVPKLTMEGDAGWIGALIINPDRRVDDSLMGHLNGVVELSLAPPDRALFQPYKDRNPSAYPQRRTSVSIHTGSLQRRQPRRVFLENLGAHDEFSPLAPCLRIETIRPVSFVAAARVLWPYSESNFADVAERSPELFQAAEDALRQRIMILEAGSIDIATLLKSNPDLLRQSRTFRGLPVVEAARRSVVHYEREQLAKKAGDVVTPVVVVGMSPDFSTLSETEAGRYVQLGEEIGMDKAVLAAHLPQVKDMEQTTFEALLDEVLQISTDRTVRLRDVIRILSA